MAGIADIRFLTRPVRGYAEGDLVGERGQTLGEGYTKEEKDNIFKAIGRTETFKNILGKTGEYFSGTTKAETPFDKWKWQQIAKLYDLARVDEGDWSGKTIEEIQNLPEGEKSLKALLGIPALAVKGVQKATGFLFPESSEEAARDLGSGKEVTRGQYAQALLPMLEFVPGLGFVPVGKLAKLGLKFTNDAASNIKMINAYKMDLAKGDMTLGDIFNKIEPASLSAAVPEKPLIALTENQQKIIQKLVESKSSPKSDLHKISKVELFNSIFSDPNLIKDPLLINKLARELNNKGLYLGSGIDPVNNARTVLKRIITRAKKGNKLNPKAVENFNTIATEGKREGAKMSHPYLHDPEVQARAQATKAANWEAAGKYQAWNEIPEGGIVPPTIADAKRKGKYTWEKIIGKLPPSKKKIRIKNLYDEIREMNPPGTLHADHFIEVQSGGKNSPFNIVAITETGHRGIEFPKGNFINKSTLVNRMDELNREISQAWQNPNLKESIKNRTHDLVKEKDKLYNSQIDLQAGTGHLFDAKIPGDLIKKGNEIVFKPHKIDSELQEILSINNSYRGAGKNKFGQFDNAEDHLIDQLTRLRDSLQEAIHTNFGGDVNAYKKYIKKYQKEYDPESKAQRSIVGLMSQGGIVGISQLTRPI